MIVDFHSHTSASDGSLVPEDLLALMRRRNVSLLSITDHDTLQAYDDASVRSFAGARIVPGIEINTTWRDNEVHVLGYGFALGPSRLADTLERNRAHRRERMERIVSQLGGAGYPVTMEQVLAEAAGGHALGRPHVAKALIRAGMIPDIETAFRTLLSRGGPGYVPSQHITPLEAIRLISESGGVPVLAHPGRLRDESIVDELAEAGLVGIEVFYPTHAPGQVAHYRAQAGRLGLVMTAGSDFHDSRYNTRGVGMDVDENDLRPFLELVA